jgi:hypothetical protein
LVLAVIRFGNAKVAATAVVVVRKVRRFMVMDFMG